MSTSPETATVVTTHTPAQERVSCEVARAELAKFFVVADLAERAPEMFSAYIDAEWHRLLGTPEYHALCRDAVGHPVGHLAEAGCGTPSWLDLYHARFGTLPAVWFADAAGNVDHARYEGYLAGHCAARDRRSGEADADARARPLIVAWDCLPTTNDPDDYRPPTPTRRTYVTVVYAAVSAG